MSTRTFISRRVIALLLLLLVAARCRAWGPEGHRLTALVADSYLTPAAREQVQQLLGRQTLADISSWADDDRPSHSETAPWHYVNIPMNAEGYDRERDCEAQKNSAWRNCVVDRILYFEQRLGDPSLPRANCIEALKFLVHFIGDIHQPFHALGVARGGNDILVTVQGSLECSMHPCNLHAVWDETLIHNRALSEPEYLELLQADIAARRWKNAPEGTPAAWADASHKLATQAFVTSGSVLSEKYVAQADKVVDAQLALGGLRLADVLNRILDPASAPSATLPTRPATP